MRVLSLYFSGTGGTKAFQKLVQHSCKNYDVEFTEIDITKNNVGISEKFLNKFDVYLIGAPIMFYSPPTSFIQNIKSIFTVGNNKRVILYTTSTSCRDSAIYTLARTLRRRGYIISGVVDVASSNNFYYSDTLRPPKANSKQYVIEDYQVKARIVKELIFTTTSLERRHKYKPIKQMRYSTSIWFLKVFFINSFAFRNFHASNNICQACGTCATRCPNNNIEMHNYRPIFKTNCTACSRCIQKCPVNAITYKDKAIKQMTPLTMSDFGADIFGNDNLKISAFNPEDFTSSM